MVVTQEFVDSLEWTVRYDGLIRHTGYWTMEDIRVTAKHVDIWVLVEGVPTVRRGRLIQHKDYLDLDMAVCLDHAGERYDVWALDRQTLCCIAMADLDKKMALIEEQRKRLFFRTPNDWEEFFWVQVLDPDGWRIDGKPYLEPISSDEFLSRSNSSTVTYL